MCNVLLNRKSSNELGGRLRMTRKLLSVVLACICVVVAGCGNQYVEKTQTHTNKVEEKESNDLTEQETPASIKEAAQSKEDTSPVTEEEKVVPINLVHPSIKMVIFPLNTLCLRKWLMETKNIK